MHVVPLLLKPTRAYLTSFFLSYPVDAAGSNAAGGNDAGKNLAKLENDSETFAVKKVNASLSKAIQQARIAKSMTQKALATAINEKPQVRDWSLQPSQSYATLLLLFIQSISMSFSTNNVLSAGSSLFCSLVLFP